MVLGLGIISIVIALIMAYIVYCIFKNYGFIPAWIFAAVVEIIGSILKNGGQGIIQCIIAGLIASLIGTGIEYFVYKRTNSFWGYVGGLLLACLGLGLVLVVLGIVIGMIAGSSGILSTY